jgi:6-pyruvoyltetrahydropterin/6-carboxytetrahydropterin synthase
LINRATLFESKKPAMPHETYRIRLTKDYLVFSAAHFITYAGHICERLHGHNYRVEAEIQGPLDENQYVVDFIAVRDALHARVADWDHHVLLPTRHPQIKVSWDDREVTALFEDRRWVFPRGDCVLLPVANTTTELLARCLGQFLLSDLERLRCPVPTRLQIGVDENQGQWGIWTWVSREES